MKFQIYKDKKGLWRWRAVASNGNVLADSGQGYKGSKSNILKRVRAFIEHCSDININSVEDVTNKTWTAA